MTLVEPGSGRAIIENIGNEMRIIIPTKKRAFMLLFLPLWLVFWVVGLVMVGHQILNPKGTEGSQIFLVVWLVGWAVGGIMVLAMFLWTLAGREIVIASAQYLSIEKNLFGLRTKSQYDRNQIEKCRVVPGAETGSVIGGRSFSWGFTGGTIAFDYGLKTIKFGIFLEEAEARYIIGELTKHGYIRGETAKQ